VRALGSVHHAMSIAFTANQPDAVANVGNVRTGRDPPLREGTTTHGAGGFPSGFPSSDAELQGPQVVSRIGIGHAEFNPSGRWGVLENRAGSRLL
jgi:hypothetical protein